MLLAAPVSLPGKRGREQGRPPGQKLPENDADKLILPISAQKPFRQKLARVDRRHQCFGLLSTLVGRQIAKDQIEGLGVKLRLDRPKPTGIVRLAVHCTSSINFRGVPMSSTWTGPVY